VGHHGAAASTGEALLAESRPRVALVSVGRDNSYGHPAAEVLERLAVYGAQVLRTDKQGTVEFITDGARYWIRTRATLASEGGAHE
jgi:competence protein ComEC